MYEFYEPVLSVRDSDLSHWKSQKEDGNIYGFTIPAPFQGHQVLYKKNKIEGRVRVVVCAANKYGPHIFIGVRHFCDIMHKNMSAHDIGALRAIYGELQGFVDQYGVFMDRKEAYEVAKAAGQVDRYRPKNPGMWLCSEDLY